MSERTVLLLAGGVWVWGSLSLTIIMWAFRRKDPVWQRVKWTLVVWFFPVLGWMFYFTMYRRLASHDLNPSDSAAGTGNEIHW